MEEVFSSAKLDTSGIRRLGEIYLATWQPVLQREHTLHTHGDLLEEVVRQFESRINVFPDGQVVCWSPQESVIGGVSALILSARRFGIGKSPDYKKVPETWHDLTAGGYFTSHHPRGNLLVCAAIFVPEQYSGKGIPRKLLHAETALAAERGLVACPYTRPIGFRQYLEKERIYTIGFEHTKVEQIELMVHLQDYLQKRGRNGSLLDKSIGIHDHFGAKVVRYLPDARENDLESCGFCVLMAYPRNYVISEKK